MTRLQSFPIKSFWKLPTHICTPSFSFNGISLSLSLYLSFFIQTLSSFPLLGESMTCFYYFFFVAMDWFMAFNTPSFVSYIYALSLPRSCSNLTKLGKERRKEGKKAQWKFCWLFLHQLRVKQTKCISTFFSQWEVMYPIIKVCRKQKELKFHG